MRKRERERERRMEGKGERVLLVNVLSSLYIGHHSEAYLSFDGSQELRAKGVD